MFHFTSSHSLKIKFKQPYVTGGYLIGPHSNSVPMTYFSVFHTKLTITIVL